MSDYISKSALIKAIDEQVKGWGKQGIVPFLFSAIAIVQNQPSLDETEIIRKAFKRVVERLEKENHRNSMSQEFRLSGSESYYEAKYKARAYTEAIEIVKEECGISE